MTEIVAADELLHLSTERIWVETEKALSEQHPEVYWQVLADCGAMTVLLPELAISQGISALGRAALHTQRTDCRWAALLADLPEARAKDASERLKTPNAYSLLAARVSSGRPRIKAALKDGTECVKLLKALDALRREEPFEGFCETLVALEQNAVDAQNAIDLLQRARDAAQQVKAADFADQGVTGPELGAAIQAAQIDRIASLIE
jgi:tRNA nucleotidyltransferase (CCA-adding enzyme)